MTGVSSGTTTTLPISLSKPITTIPAADPKLQHLVKRIVLTSINSPSNNNNNNNQSGLWTTERVLEKLLVQHREYKRKPTSLLKDQIASILQYHYQQQQQQQQLQQQTVVAAAGVKKRKLWQPAATDEDQDEKDALAADAARDTFVQEQTGGSSMLNAGLRTRYAQVSKERDVADRAAAAAAAEQEAVAAAQAAAAAEQALRNHEGSHADTAVSISESSTPQLSANGATTPLKRRKKKKGPTNTPATQPRDNPAGGGAGAGGALFGEEEGMGVFMRPVARPRERYEDLGGMEETMKQIRELVEYPLMHPELFHHLGVDPPRGVLLRGPPGCGKTHMANAIAGQLGIPYFRLSATEIVSGMSGESEQRLRNLFAAAASMAPSLVFMDEIDSIAPKRDSGGGGGKGMEKRIVAQLLTCLDGLAPQFTKDGAPVLVLGATNRPDALDAALRRAGRFDREIILGVPDEGMRRRMLPVMTRGMRLSGDFDFTILAKKTPGYVGADLRALTKEAAVLAVNRIFSTILTPHTTTTPPNNTTSSIDTPTSLKTIQNGENSDNDDTNDVATDNKDTVSASNEESNVNQVPTDISNVVPLTSSQMEPLFVTMEDFLIATTLVQPSSKREGFATVPDVSWDDIGALHSIREELTLSVLEPIAHPEKFEQLGLPLPAGVLLYGPPGCGKTLLAKAIARESGANFISVKGPELLDKYVGESERAVRVVFERARSSSPCVVFFDELDSLCPKRGSDSGGGSGVSERVVNQLLTEMDGLDSRRSVFVIAATNRPELIDPAMMRPGRLDKLLYVPLPTAEDRVSILEACATKIKLGPDVDLKAIARSSKAEGYSGADCAALLREAGLAVLRDDALSRHGLQPATAKPTSSTPVAPLRIMAGHFDYAFQHVMPSVSKKDQARYDRMRDRMARARSRVGGVSSTTTEDNNNIPDNNVDATSTTGNENATPPATTES